MPFTNLLLLHGYNYAILRITFEGKVVSIFIIIEGEAGGFFL
jgi:hypothetical protein